MTATIARGWASWRCVPLKAVPGTFCHREGCDGVYVQSEEPHFDADGSAMVGTSCDNGCGMQSCAYWDWAGCEHDEPYDCGCLCSCGHPPTKDHGPGTGYATLAEPVTVIDDWSRPVGRRYSGRVCYDCADRIARYQLTVRDKVSAYLNPDETQVITWPGGLLMTVDDAHRSGQDGSLHSSYRSHGRLYVRATDVHGVKWAGSGPAEPGSYVNLKKTKTKPPRSRAKLGKAKA